MGPQVVNILLSYLVRSECHLFYEANYGDFVRLEVSAVVISDDLFDLLGIEVVLAERRPVFDSSKAALETGRSRDRRQLVSAWIHI